MIFAGGKAGWGSHQQDEGRGDTYLLQVRGTAAFNTKAEQVNSSSCSLLQPWADSNLYIYNSREILSVCLYVHQTCIRVLK